VVSLFALKKLQLNVLMVFVYNQAQVVLTPLILSNNHNVLEMLLMEILFLVLMENVLLQVTNVDLYMIVPEVKLDVKMDLVDL